MNRSLGLVLAAAVAAGGALWIAGQPGDATVVAEPIGRAPVPGEGAASTPPDAPSPTPTDRVERDPDEVFHERMTDRYGGQDLEGLREALRALTVEVNGALMQYCQPKVYHAEAPVDDGRSIPIDTVHYRGVDREGVMRLVVLGPDEIPATQAKHREVRWLAREIERRGDSR